MGMRMYYKISLEMLNQYDNILGIDTFDAGERDIELEDDGVKFRHTDCLFPMLPPEIAKYSSKIAEYLNVIIDNLCMNFDDAEDSLLLKVTYYSAIQGILNTALSLNLTPDDSEDYVLNFHRCNAILFNVLSEISRNDYKDIISFWKCINDSSITDILHNWANKMPSSACFATLAMNGDDECKDYEIFEDDSFTINGDKLKKVLSDNIRINKQYKPNLTRFRRMTYNQAKKISSKN